MSAAIAQQITDAANHYGVDPGLAIQVASVESGMNQAAVSPKGARGVFQLMPATAASLGVNPNDAAQNIDGGVRYLAQLLSKYGGDSSKALAAYNWGPTNLDNAIAARGASWLSALPDETLNYIAKILGAVPSAPIVATNTAASGADSFSTGVIADVLPAVVDTSSGNFTNMLLLGAVAVLFLWAYEEGVS